MTIFKENKKYVYKKGGLSYEVPVIRLRMIFINLCRSVISMPKENKVDLRTLNESTDFYFIRYIFDIYTV